MVSLSGSPNTRRTRRGADGAGGAASGSSSCFLKQDKSETKKEIIFILKNNNEFMHENRSIRGL